MFLYRTVELFTGTGQNTVFTSVGSHLSGISDSTQGVYCLNSFVGRPDSIAVAINQNSSDSCPDKPKSGINEVRKNEGRVYTWFCNENWLLKKTTFFTVFTTATWTKPL